MFDQADMDAIKHSEVSRLERCDLFGVLRNIDYREGEE